MVQIFSAPSIPKGGIVGIIQKQINLWLKTQEKMKKEKKTVLFSLNLVGTVSRTVHRYDGFRF